MPVGDLLGLTEAAVQAMNTIVREFIGASVF